MVETQAVDNSSVLPGDTVSRGGGRAEKRVRGVSATDHGLDVGESPSNSRSLRRRKVDTRGSGIGRQVEGVCASLALDEAGDTRTVAKHEDIVAGAAEKGSKSSEGNAGNVAHVGAGDVERRTPVRPKEQPRSITSGEVLNICDRAKNRGRGRIREIHKNGTILGLIVAECVGSTTTVDRHLDDRHVGILEVEMIVFHSPDQFVKTTEGKMSKGTRVDAEIAAVERPVVARVGSDECTVGTRHDTERNRGHRRDREPDIGPAPD